MSLGTLYTGMVVKPLFEQSTTTLVVPRSHDEWHAHVFGHLLRQ